MQRRRRPILCDRSCKMSMTSNPRLHRTLHQRCCACWCRAGEAERSASRRVPMSMQPRNAVTNWWSHGPG
jgi:hypothetical protein